MCFNKQGNRAEKKLVNFSNKRNFFASVRVSLCATAAFEPRLYGNCVSAVVIKIFALLTLLAN